MIKMIIVPDGELSLGTMYTACLAFYNSVIHGVIGKCLKIVRKQPTSEEVNDPETLVLGFKNINDPSKNTFGDVVPEHGFSIDDTHTTFVRYIKHLGFIVEPWVENIVHVDVVPGSISSRNLMAVYNNDPAILQAKMNFMASDRDYVQIERLGNIIYNKLYAYKSAIDNINSSAKIDDRFHIRIITLSQFFPNDILGRYVGMDNSTFNNVIVMPRGDEWVVSVMFARSITFPQTNGCIDIYEVDEDNKWMYVPTYEHAMMIVYLMFGLNNIAMNDDFNQPEQPPIETDISAIPKPLDSTIDRAVMIRMDIEKARELGLYN